MATICVFPKPQAEAHGVSPMGWGPWQDSRGTVRVGGQVASLWGRHQVEWSRQLGVGSQQHVSAPAPLARPHCLPSLQGQAPQGGGPGGRTRPDTGPRGGAQPEGWGAREEGTQCLPVACLWPPSTLSFAKGTSAPWSPLPRSHGERWALPRPRLPSSRPHPWPTTVMSLPLPAPTQGSRPALLGL